MSRIKKSLPFLLVGILLAAVLFMIGNRVAKAPTDNETTDTRRNTDTEPFDQSRYPIDKPGSLWWVVNKKRPAGTTYAPNDLVVPNVSIRPNGGTDERQISKRISTALENMFTQAHQDGASLMMASGYRSYALQATIYDQNVQSLGQAEADRVSAKAGTSEHQTGLALDVEPASRECEIQICFGQLPEGRWLAEHAHEYGFIIRYPKGKEAVTGYNYEPWHIRYVGKSLAAEMQKRKIKTLEEFFNL